MQAITRGWPPERRAAQAQNIRKTRPWLKATGPRTPAGKAKIIYNAFKHGHRIALWREVRSALAAQNRFRRLVNPLLNPNLSPQEFMMLKTAIFGSKFCDGFFIFHKN
jgi:hypothetical protein